MTKEEIISMLSKELNSEWTNGVTCLMVENSDSYIPVIVHHNKNELIVEVGEQDKKIYRIGRNELNTHCYHQTMSYYNSGASTPFRTDTDYYQAVGG
ncbi:MAG: hypothetical protein ACLU9R_04895 [Faecalibacterium sp.]